MRLIVFTDIDDTLMQTARKLPETGSLAVGARSRDGSASSFMTAKQAALWALLDGKADRIIPVTARSSDALSRVALPFLHEAVVDFGATILRPDGTRDQAWHGQLLEESKRQRTMAVFEQLKADITRRYGARLLKTELRVCDALPCFVSFRTAADCAALQFDVEQALEAEACRADYYLHVTDRDVTVLPYFISKSRAVAHLVTAHGYHNDLTLGFGDSLTDLPFMAQCDFMAMPPSSRLGQAAQRCAGDVK